MQDLHNNYLSTSICSTIICGVVTRHFDGCFSVTFMTISSADTKSLGGLTLTVL